MASASAKLAFLLSLNLVFFTLVSSHIVHPTPPPPPHVVAPPPHEATPPPPTPAAPATCPRGRIDITTCISILNLINITVNPSSQCCAEVSGLADVQAGVCICTALRGVPLLRSLQASMSLLLTHCARDPNAYTCQ